MAISPPKLPAAKVLTPAKTAPTAAVTPAKQASSLFDFSAKTIAASKTPTAVTKTTTPTPAAPKFTLPDPVTTLKNIIAGKGGSDTQINSATGDTYYLYPSPNGSAQWYVTPKGSTLASPVSNPTTNPTVAGNAQGVTLKTLTADRTKYYTANPTGAAKAAAAAINTPENLAAKAATEAKLKPGVTTAASTPDVTAQNKIRSDFVNNVINKIGNQVPTQAQIDDYKKAITDAGGTPNDSLVGRAQGYINQAAQDAKAAQAQEFRNEIVRASNDQTLTKAQIADITSRAEKAGTPLDAQTITNANNSAQQFLNTNYTNQVYNATTQKQIDDIVAKAKADGATVNSATLANTTKNVAAWQAQTNDIAKFVTDQQTMPGMPQVIYGPNNATLYSIPPDSTTGFKGGWYSFASGGYQELGKDGQPTGKIIPETDLMKQANDVGYNLAMKAGNLATASSYASQLKDPAKYEATLPKPTTAEFTKAQLINPYLGYGAPELAIPNDGHNPDEGYVPRTGPDGTDYIYQPSNIVTGAPGQWLKSTSNQNVSNTLKNYVPIGQPTAAPVSYQNQVATIDQQVKQNYATAQQIANQINEQYRQEQYNRAHANDGGDDIFAQFDKFINNTVGWKTIATIAGSMVGGPLGGAIANATAGAIKGESLEQIAKGAALSYAISYGTEALGEALNQTVSAGVETGAIDSNVGDQVTQGVTDLTNGDAATFVDPVEGTVTTVDPGAGTTTVTDATGATTVTNPSAGTVTTTDPSGAVTTNPIPAEPVAPSPGTEYTGGQDTGHFYDTTPVTEPPTAPVAPEVAPVTGAPIEGTPEAHGFSQAELNAMYEGANAPVQPGGQVAGPGTGIPQGEVTVGSPTGEIPTEAIAPTTPSAPSMPAGYQEIPNPVANLDPGGIESQGFQYNETTGEWFNPETGVGYLPELGKWIGPTAGITAEQLAVGAAILGGAGAIAAAGGGGGGAATAAVPGAVPPTTTTTPVNPTTSPPTTPTTPVSPTTPTAPGGTGVTPGTPAPGTINPGTPTNPTGTVPGTVTPGTPTGPYAPQPVVPGTPPSSQVVPPGTTAPPPTVTPPGPQNPVKITDYSEPYKGEYSNESVLDRYMNKTISYGDIAALVAAGLVLPSILGLLAPPPATATPAKRSYGPIPPTEWGNAAELKNPGQNPGWFTGNFPAPAYQTTNPYQAQFYWGQHPYVGANQPREVYNQIPAEAGTQGFGLQAGPSQYNTNQLINQINQTALDPNFVGYNQYPTQGYVAPVPSNAPTGPVLPIPPVALTGFIR